MYMPQRYKADRADRNITRLTPMLKEAGVNYVDLYKLFGGQKKVLYHKTDSHWNNRGADLVNRALLKNLGKSYTVYDQKKVNKRADFQGDLFAMVIADGYYGISDTYGYTVEVCFGEKLLHERRRFYSTEE